MNYSLNITPDSNALVTGDEIHCGSNCKGEFPAGTQIELNVTPNAGYQLESWNGACEGISKCTVTLSKNQNISIKISPVIPPIPVEITESLNNNSSIDLTWRVAASNNQEITYSVFRNDNLVANGLSNARFSDDDVNAGQTYRYQIRAENQFGHTSDLSTGVSVTLPTPTDTNAPNAPKSVAPLSITQSSVILEWSASQDNPGGVGVESYLVYLNFTLVTEINSNLTQYQFTNLTPATNYNFQISARDAAGNESVLTEAISIKTLSTPEQEDITPPSEPTNLLASEIKASSVTLNWNPSTDFDGSGVNKYLIYRNNSLLAEHTAELPTFTDTNVNSGNEYHYQISAVDMANNESSLTDAIIVSIISNAIDKDNLFIPGSTIIDAPVTTIGWNDIDGDGDADIFAAEGGKHSCGEDCRLLSWFEAPTWIEHKIGELLGPFTGDSALTDMDGDGDPDIVIAKDEHNRESNDDAVYWFENRNNGQEWKRNTIEFDVPNAYHIGELRVSDIDGDSKMDVVIRHLGTYRFVIYFQNSANSWTPVRLNTHPREGLGLADLDGDGRTDILGNGFVLFAPPNPRVEEWQEVIVDAAFFNQPVSGLNNSSKISTADFNNDGRTDLILSSAEGDEVYLAWYSNPPNTRNEAWTKHTIENPQSNNHQILPFDVDGDKDIDILGGFAFGDKGVYWWENTSGDGLNWQRRIIDPNLGCYSCLATDFDNDGDIDLAGPRDYRDNVYLFENRTSD